MSEKNLKRIFKDSMKKSWNHGMNSVKNHRWNVDMNSLMESREKSISTISFIALYWHLPDLLRCLNHAGKLRMLLIKKWEMYLWKKCVLVIFKPTTLNSLGINLGKNLEEIWERLCRSLKENKNPYKSLKEFQMKYLKEKKTLSGALKESCDESLGES